MSQKRRFGFRQITAVAVTAALLSSTCLPSLAWAKNAERFNINPSTQGKLRRETRLGEALARQMAGNVEARIGVEKARPILRSFFLRVWVLRVQNLYQSCREEIARIRQSIAQIPTLFRQAYAASMNDGKPLWGDGVMAMNLPRPFGLPEPYPLGGHSESPPVAESSVRNIIEDLIARYTARAEVPASIASDPENYRVGPSLYADVREHENNHFRRYLNLALRDSSENKRKEAGEHLEELIRRPELDGLSSRQAEEIVYEFIKIVTGNRNPLQKYKEIAQKSALDLLPHFERENRGEWNLLTALCGNRVRSNEFSEAALNGDESLEKYAFSFPDERSPTLDHRAELLADLRAKPHSKILYLLDNVIEDVHDLALIRWLLEQGHTVTLVGKQAEADNDATVDDIHRLLSYPEVREFLTPERIERQLRVISSGSATRGTDLRRVTPEFIQAWSDADTILVKGEGNRGTLSHVTKDYYNLAVVKVPHEMPGFTRGQTLIEKVRSSTFEPPESNRSTWNPLFAEMTEEARLALISSDPVRSFEALLHRMAEIAQDTKIIPHFFERLSKNLSPEELGQLGNVVFQMETGSTPAEYRDQWTNRERPMNRARMPSNPQTRKIATLTLNPCLGVTADFGNSLSYSGYLPAERTLLEPGGKSLTISVGLHAWGIDPITIAPIGGATGDLIRRLLRERGMSSDFLLPIQDESRMYLLLHSGHSEQKEISCRSPHISSAELAQMEERLWNSLGTNDILVLAGSLPEGVPPDYYETLISESKRKGIRTYCDAKGEPLEYAIEARPSFLGINVYEFAAYLDRDPKELLENLPRVAYYSRKLIQSGIETVVISLGSKGMVLSTKEGSWWARPPPVREISSTGAGDTIKVAFAYTELQGGAPLEALRLACAASAVTVTKPGLVPSTLDEAKTVLDQVSIEEIEIPKPRGNLRTTDDENEINQIKREIARALADRDVDRFNTLQQVFKDRFDGDLLLFSVYPDVT